MGSSTPRTPAEVSVRPIRATAPSTLLPTLQLLPNHPPEEVFGRLVGLIHIPAESLVDERLVVAASLVDPVPEPLQHLVIQADGDPGLVHRGPSHRSSLPPLKSYSLFIAVPCIPFAFGLWPCEQR
jgi:hypothetical protein